MGNGKETFGKQSKEVAETPESFHPVHVKMMVFTVFFRMMSFARMVGGLFLLVVEKWITLLRGCGLQRLWLGIVVPAQGNAHVLIFFRMVVCDPVRSIHGDVDKCQEED